MRQTANDILSKKEIKDEFRELAQDMAPQFCRDSTCIVALAEFALEILERIFEHPLVGAEGHLHALDKATTTWKALDSDGLESCLMLLSGLTGADAKKIKFRSKSMLEAVSSSMIRHPAVRNETAFSESDGIVSDGKIITVEIKRGGHNIVKKPAKPEHFAKIHVDLPVKPAPTPQWDRFLDSLFREDADKKSKIALIQEFIGVGILGQSAKIAKVLLALGQGANGKSVLQNAIAELIPEYVTHCAPETWGDSRGPTLLADGKRLNIVPEISSKALRNTQSFKAIVSGDPVQIDPKYRSPYTMRSCAGHFLSANKLPEMNESSYAIDRRIVILTFNQNFHRLTEARRSEAEILASLEPERGAIIHKCLESACTALNRQGYSTPRSHKEELKIWTEESCPVARFAEECLEPDPCERDYEAVHYLHSVFSIWCRDTNERTLSEREFSAKFRVLPGQSNPKRKSYGGKRIPSFRAKVNQAWNEKENRARNGVQLDFDTPFPQH